MYFRLIISLRLQLKCRKQPAENVHHILYLILYRCRNLVCTINEAQNFDPGCLCKPSLNTVLFWITLH